MQLVRDAATPLQQKLLLQQVLLQLLQQQRLLLQGLQQTMHLWLVRRSSSITWRGFSSAASFSVTLLMSPKTLNPKP